MPGFNKIGYLLSPLAARPAMEKRVTDSMHSTAANSVFRWIATPSANATTIIPRSIPPPRPMTWPPATTAWPGSPKHFAVVGSEGGVWYAAPVIHYAHGMTTGVVGWGDKDMRDRKSPYFQGAYWPPDGPAILLKPVPLKDKYVKLDVDPRYRLPLYEVAFHDSVVATEEEGSGTLKFSNVQGTRILTELLYETPPMYHLNTDQWQKQEGIITRQFAFFSPLHREVGLLPMTDFKWLSEDRAVQETVFGEHEVELVANFGDKPFAFEGQTVPAGSILAYWPAKKEARLFKAE